jgi:hypothetical protein
MISSYLISAKVRSLECFHNICRACAQRTAHCALSGTGHGYAWWVGISCLHLPLFIFHSGLLANIDLLWGSALCRPISVLCLDAPLNKKKSVLCSTFCTYLPSDPKRRHTRTWRYRPVRKRTRTLRVDQRVTFCIHCLVRSVYFSTLKIEGSGFCLQRGLRYGDFGSHGMSKI